MRPWCATAVAGLLIAGCASASNGHPATSPTTTTTTPAISAAPVDPNAAVCLEVKNYIIDHVRPTFGSWHIHTNPFDERISGQMRDEATHLYGLAARASGSTVDAIRGEATAITKLSIGIDEQDGTAIGDAASAANVSLADLRGTCNF